MPTGHFNLTVFQQLEHLFLDHNPATDPEDGVVLAEIPCPLTEQNLAILQGLINPEVSHSSDKDLYIETLNLVQTLSN